MGLVRDGLVLAEAAFPSRYTLAKRLLTRLDWLLGEAGATKQDLEGVAVSLGPGSFTGVRIGLAAAKTLAQWMQIPLVGISTLEALAYPFRECTDSLLVPLINARRKQAYVALYHGESGALQRITSDLLLSAEPFIEELQHHLDGFNRMVLSAKLKVFLRRSMRMYRPPPVPYAVLLPRMLWPAWLQNV
jgi:tRNA threonylcarbamoyladenosine biosynthesis protein TsaB